MRGESPLGSSEPFLVDEAKPRTPLEERGRHLAHHPLNVIDDMVGVEIHRHGGILVAHELGNLGHRHAFGEQLRGDEVPQGMERVRVAQAPHE